MESEYEQTPSLSDHSAAPETTRFVVKAVGGATEV